VALSGFSGSSLPTEASNYLSLWLATTLVIPLPFLHEDQVQHSTTPEQLTMESFQSRRLLSIPEMTASVNVSEQQFLETFLFWFAVLALVIPLAVIVFCVVEEVYLTKCRHRQKQELEELEWMVDGAKESPSVGAKVAIRTCKVWFCSVPSKW